ncbi:MAG: HD domain-containing protein [Holosporales bacterium]|jgi:putative nucleotidyltransferase with HDIG domain|nr:HD domain-containing protein [Holosporales bacterium]
MKNLIKFFESFLPNAWDKSNINTYNHSLTVAKAARTIASNTNTLSPEKAFLYGLMHDIGKFFLKNEEKYKHPRIGYELFSKEYNDIAEICITHPFPNLNIKSYHIYYCEGDVDEANKIDEILSKLESNEYIELIQLCDKLSGLNSYMTIKAKFEWYKSNYLIEEKWVALNYEKLTKIKSKFDVLIKGEVYDLLL